MGPRRARNWRVFREGDGPVAGPPAWAYVAMFVACMAIGLWSVAAYQSVLIWPANGVLLAAVLLLPRRQAISVLAACFAVNIAGNILRQDPPHMMIINAVLNFGEVFLAAALARRFCGATLDLRRPVRLARFVFFCIAPSVALSALIGVTARTDIGPDIYLISLGYWFTIETAGFLATTPALLLFARASAFGGDKSPAWEKAALMSTLALVTVAVFAQNHAPVLFLIFLPLMVIAFRLQPHWSALSVILIAAIGSAFSLNGLGPLTLSSMAPLDWPQQDVIPILNVLPGFHLFMAATLALSFGASTVLTERRRLEDQLKARTATAQHAQAQAEAAGRRIAHMAQHDAETGLLNRAGLENAAGEMLDARHGRGVYVAALSIDRFTAIRTAIGSQQAAVLLEQAARRLEYTLRRATVGRLSPDVVGVALRAQSLAEAADLLTTACEAFSEPLTVGQSRVDIRFTVGLAAAPEHASDAHALIERAQVALDQARLNRRPLAMFDAAAERAAAGGLALLSELRAGLDNGAVWLAHQPKLDLRSGAWTGVECLMRWTHVERGPAPPDTFIPLLEETGAVDAVTTWVLERALIERGKLARAGMDFNVAVNVSARSLSEPGFAERMAGVVIAKDVEPAVVTLEITETALMAKPDVALDNIEGFKRAGFRVAIDDYGAGMSSLSYLKRIPADELKIDQAFVRFMAQNKTDAVLVRSTIELAHSLGLKVVAEGVEDAQALEMLRSFGCDYAQGYFIARPMPVERLLEIKPEQARAVA